MAWWHRKGQKVVCVDDEWSAGPSPNRPCNLKKGAVYTISGISRVPGNYCRKANFGLLIEGAPNIPRFGDFDLGWASARFRPVQHRDTSATVAEIIRKSHETPADLELV
jgi:hypothetical protein